ncbi:hypothetical protein POJ06DRAFT_269928 [Lipomyces tetrasporus]|uniref:PSI domain-containing protein n=1 Tax=Lipomyces tetrasporus TaxID=54092 RepID=A0AAD7QP25_9ASCO|nr:uncharacterized protein POJ06DRAFT_269928 [Lipomyces tetrasporus]KAJ8098855.1 hypothetical protein POJ06DRAFT_269928 [Lipomyces tetrasporus]
MSDMIETIVLMDNLTLSSHTDVALRLMGIHDPDSYMQECLQYSTNCRECIGAPTSQPCGWCPFSQVCVPDPGHLGILAAIRDRDICPFPTERYEFRARQLGCSVSSVTLWSTVVAVVVAVVVVILVAAVTTWIARRRVLVWVSHALQDEREKIDANRETSSLMRTGDEEQGYQSITTPSNLIPEVYDADDEDDGSPDEKMTDAYVYDPQMMPASSQRPRLHQSPRRRGYEDMYERYRVPDSPDSRERGRGLFRIFSDNMKGLYYS